MPPLLFIPLTLLSVGVLLVISSILRRTGVASPEVARKIVHVGMGMICLSFPTLGVSTTSVMLLAVLATAALLILRLTKASNPLSSALFSIDRSSSGELLFPIAVAWVYAASDGNWLLYVIPVLVLTLSDAAGALIGTRYGAGKYQSSDGTKSVEGSVSFFLVTFLAIHIPLLLGSATGRAECLLIALVIGAFATAVEGMSGKGTDNLLVPIGTFFLLDRYLPMDSTALVMRGAALIVILFLLLTTRKSTSLNGGALLAALLYGFGALHLGGIVPLASLLLMFGIHVVSTTPLKRRGDVAIIRHSTNHILALALPCLGWLLVQRSGVIPEPWGHVGFAITAAVQAGLLHTSTWLRVDESDHHTITGVIKSLVVVLPIVLIVELRALPGLMILVALAAWGCSFIFRAWRLPLQPDDPLNGWVKLTLVATTASVAIYFVAQLPLVS